MLKLFRLNVIFIALGLFCFAASAELFAQRKHPAESSKAARSWAMDFETSIEFSNETGNTVRLYWLDSNAERNYLFELKDGQSKRINTFVSYMYLVTDEQNNSLSMYSSDAQPRFIQLRNSDFDRRPPRDRDRDDDENYRGKNYDTTPIKICGNQEIPRGFLITAAESDFNCPNWSPGVKNSYTIQRPSRTAAVKICSSSQTIPRGFVVTSAESDFNCSNWSPGVKNAYTIKIPGDTETICSISETPRGFVVTSSESNFNCPNWSPGVKNSSRIQRIK